MTSAHEPVLHALSVEPSVARPGETVCVIFRTRNLGTSASPAGTVTFDLDEGFEVLGESEVAVGSVPPGDDVVATICARIAGPFDDLSRLAVRAVLRVPDTVLATNTCRVLVRTRPVLDGAQSGTFVELLDAERVRVRAVVTNEGDGAARDLRLDIPAPAGCVRADADAPAVMALERLEVGASVTVTFEARIVEPVVVIQASEAEVRHGAGLRCMLPVREVIVLEPVIAAPCVAVRPERRSVDVMVDVRNDGWVDARDVRVRIALPGTLRVIDGIVVDGVPVTARGAKRAGGDPPFARLERSGSAHVVIVRVPARTTARIALTATFPSSFSGGSVVVGVGPHEVAAHFEPELARAVRMRAIDVPRTVPPSGELRVAAEVVNAGDAPENLFFCIAGAGIVVAPEAVSRAIAPGSVAVVELTARVRETAPHDEPLLLSLIACDAERERARTEFAFVVRDRPAPCCQDPAGTEAAGMPGVVHAALRGPDAVSAGAAFTIHADIDVEDPVGTLAVRARDVASASYVPGSTVLDGRSLLDRGGSSPLAGDGLVLRGVPAGTRISAAWTLLADPSASDEALIAEAVLEVDGCERPCESIAVHVHGRDAFTPQPAGLPYHVDACVVAVGSPAAAPEERLPEDSRDDPAPEDVFTFELLLDSRHLEEVARMLGAAGGGLVTDVLALRMLLPDGETSGHAGIASALDGVRCALHDVLDRLFVKLRIPGFAVASDDLDDVVLRSAMIGLFERLLDAPPGGDRGDGATVRITRERIRELLDAFEDTAYGSPAMLRALVALLPARCAVDAPLSAAMAQYRCAFDDVLLRYDGVPLELFDDALVHVSDRALDDARASLAVALRGQATFAELAC